MCPRFKSLVRVEFDTGDRGDRGDIIVVDGSKNILLHKRKEFFGVLEPVVDIDFAADIDLAGIKAREELKFEYLEHTCCT